MIKDGNAVKPVLQDFDKLIEAIEVLCEPEETLDTRGAAEILLPAVCNFTFICYLSMWSQVLEQVNHAQKYLQISGISLEKSIVHLKSLKLYLRNDRNDIVGNALNFATTKCDRRIRNKKKKKDAWRKG